MILNRSEWLEAVLVAAVLLSLSSLISTPVFPPTKIIWSLANLLAGLCVYYSGNTAGKIFLPVLTRLLVSNI
jgi:hypothetical protein